MCLKKLAAFFKSYWGVVKPIPEPVLVLPYPEEKPDYSQTLENTRAEITISLWLVKYNVPFEHWDYWKTKIVITVTNKISYPAQTWEQDNIRHLAVKPEWLNPGILAHEQAHNSYALLDDEWKRGFNAVYASVKTTDPLIKLLYSINTYGLTSDIEGHAEVYRYLGNKMPEVLKEYYPKLF